MSTTSTSPCAPRCASRASSCANLAGALLVAALGAALATGCGETHGGDQPPLPEIPVLRYATVEDPIEPLPVSVEIQHPDRVELGRKLFFDPILSNDGTLACNSCHDIPNGGSDNLPFSKHREQAPGVNTPTVLNVGQLYWLHWAGAYARLEDQIDTPLTSPKVLASTWDDALARLRAERKYSRGFAAAYPDGLTEANVRDAIASFERTLVTPNSPFDRHLRGEQGALMPQALEGYQLFKDLGCISCHQGMGIGGNMFQRFGVMKDYFAGTTGPAAELSRFAVTGLEKDRYVFRVASLRNVALTAPYFHDGSAPTLEEAVSVMAEYQLGRELSPDQVEAIVAFLRSLTGEIPRVSAE